MTMEALCTNIATWVKVALVEFGVLVIGCTLVIVAS